MASFDSTQYAKQKPTRANTSRNATENISDGSVEFATIAYTLAGTETANDTINLCILPAGAIVVPQLSSVFSADPGTTLTLDIGTAADADAFADGITLSSGGRVEFTSGTAPAALTPTGLTADTGSGNAVVYATVASAASLTASVVLHFLIAYKRNR